MVSSAEGLVTTSTVEDIATVVVVEHSATEVALSRSRHLRHVVQILPERDWSVQREVTRFPFEDLHEPLSISQDLASFKDNHRKAFHELLREFHDNFQVPDT